MTITKRLLALPPDQKIKIGAKGGTSFFYIGTAEDFVDNIWPYTTAAREWNNGNCARAENLLRQALGKDHSPRDYCEKILLDPLSYPTMQGYQSYVENYFANIATQKKYYERALKSKNCFRPLYEREVLEERKADADPGYLILIITGMESGIYWTSDEVTPPSLTFVRSADHAE